MIGFIQGTVLFCDGVELIAKTQSGVGYQIFCNKIFSEGASIELFISHIVKETSEDLYGFSTLLEKKFFELLLSVKGVGPKSAHSLLSSLNVEELIFAVKSEDKKKLSSAQGIGTKAAAQIILDLQNKIDRIQMYTVGYSYVPKNLLIEQKNTDHSGLIENDYTVNNSEIYNEAILACTELGFSEKKIIPMARKILESNNISKAEQLVHLVLKEL